MEIAIILLLAVIIAFSILNYISKSKSIEDTGIEDKNKISELEKSVAVKDETIKQYQQNIELANVRISDLEQLKAQNITLRTKLESTEAERNTLKNETTFLKKEEENRNENLRKSLEKSNTLQESLEKEKERLNDERVKEKNDHFEKMKKLWGEHEKDVEKHIQMICKNLILKYIPQEKFPYSRNKPDNTIEISSQLIVFDAKSPSNDDLSNFPKYIKSQTENLKKYAKHADVKKELFLVVPSNTLSVIQQYTYKMGDYNVYVITKDALEPIILSLKRIQDFELVEKLSPEERDDICRIIGKFAHTTKRRIQIDQYFADEFLDTLKKAGSQLPREILKSVIDFEGAEMLNPPMEKRNKKIVTQALIDKRIELSKEIEIRDIPEIDAEITFKEKDEGTEE